MSGVDIHGASKPMSRVMFDKYNTDPSTGINKEGFHELCYSLGHYLDGEAFEAAWTILDKDGSGYISYDEWKEWWTSVGDRWEHLQLDEDQIKALVQLHEYFRYFDVNSDGSLSEEEFEQAYEYMLQTGYALKECARTNWK